MTRTQALVLLAAFDSRHAVDILEDVTIENLLDALDAEQQQSARQNTDEEPERWDGLS